MCATNMNFDDITAENMKKLATIDSEDTNELLTRIKTAAEKGKLSLYISDYHIKDTTKAELERRGFRVQIGGRYNEMNCVIMWG